MADRRLRESTRHIKLVSFLMLDHVEALAIIHDYVDIERYRRECADDNPDPAARERWRHSVIRMAEERLNPAPVPHPSSLIPHPFPEPKPPSSGGGCCGGFDPYTT